MNCYSFGFWFELGRVAAGLAIVGAVFLVILIGYGVLAWRGK